MKKRELNKYIAVGIIVLTVCIIVKNLRIIGGFLSLTASAFYPLLLGAAIAFVFNIFLSFCEKFYFPCRTEGFIARSRRCVCLTFAVTLTLTVIILIVYIVVPEFIKGLRLVFAELPAFIEETRAFLIRHTKEFPELQKRLQSAETDWGTILNPYFESKTGGIVGSVTNILGTLTLTLTKITLAVIFAIYILACKNGIKAGLRRAECVYLGNKTRLKVNRYFEVANYTFRKFFIGQFAEAIVLGVLCLVGMAILRLPYVLMTSVIIGVTALVPILGAFVGAILGAFMIFTVSPAQALIFLIFLMILQQIETNFIYPRVVGLSIGLPGIWVLASVAVGGTLFGVTGMLLGVPIVATVYKLVNEDIEKRELLGRVQERLESEAKKIKDEKDGHDGLYGNAEPCD